MHGSRSIRQRMKYLEIDPVLIIAHPKRSVFCPEYKVRCRVHLLLLYHCRNITSLQINQNSPFLKTARKRGYFPVSSPGLPAGFLLLSLLSVHSKTKYPGVILSCHRRERQRRIVKFSPLCIFVLHDAFLLPVPLFPENDLHMQSSPAHAEI